MGGFQVITVILLSVCAPIGTWADNNEIYLKNKMQAPLAERIEMLDYEEPPDALSDTSEEYALVQDALPDGKIQRVQSTLKRDFRPGNLSAVLGFRDVCHYSRIIQ